MTKATSYSLSMYRDSQGRELWLAEQCADYIGVEPRTWHGYVSRPTVNNPAPKPVDKVGRSPMWLAIDVKKWQKARPGGPPPRRAAGDVWLSADN